MKLGVLCSFKTKETDNPNLLFFSLKLMFKNNIL